MDKRKITQASPVPEGEDRARKRRKQSTALQQNGNGADGTSTQVLGQGLLNAIMNHQERNRHVRQHFEKLPSQSDYPDYYHKIKNPISLHEIQTKLNNNQYSTLQDVHSDLLLMCQNAATYNKPKSQVHSDSIRVRNVIESYMAEQSSRHVKREESAQPTPGRQASSRTAKPSPAALQQEQIKIVDDMMALVDDQGEPVAHYFVNLPSKKLYGEYFRIIKTPISLNMIKKKILQGEYSKWSDFEYAIGLIKKNAEEFNAEGSDIVKDARRLDEYFVKRIAEGKSKVGEVTNGTGSGIKLRLNMGAHRAQSPQKPTEPPASAGPKIRLNVGKQHGVAMNNSLPVAASPPQPRATPRVGRALSKSPVPPTVAPVVNGNSASPVKQQVNNVARNITSQKSVTSPNPIPVSLPPVASTSSTSLPIGSFPPVPVMNATPQTPEKAESVGTNRSRSPPSDSITVRANSTSRTQMSPPVPNSAMPPPPQRLSSTPASTPGPSSLSPAPLNVPVPVPPHHRQNTGYYEEPRYRAEGKDASSALITNFHIMSAPSISTEHKFAKDLSPDDQKVTTQFFLHLPMECHTIVITPTLSAQNLAHRPYKLMVEHKVSNNSPRQISPWAAQQKKKEEPPFEVRLSPGVVNTIECTLVTAALRGGSGGGGGGFLVNGTGVNGIGGWELERFRVFVSLLPN